MLTPNRSNQSAPNLSNQNESSHNVLTLRFAGQSVTVSHDGFTIGSSRQCDVTLDDRSVPALHSIVHIQSGAMWIEVAADELSLIVNDRPYRRLALRHEDRITIGATEICFLIHDGHLPLVSDEQLAEDLSLLTAEELCDRILSEQEMVNEFIEGQRSGWEALLQAIHSTNEEHAAHSSEGEESSTADPYVGLDALLEQIQVLKNSVTDHTRELTDQERAVLETTSMIEESQLRAVQQLDEILEKLKNSDPPNGLRASA